MPAILQAGKQRISKTDGLGRLTDVWEVTPADAWTSSVTFNGQNYIAYQTSYQYDAMDDLVKEESNIVERGLA